MTTGLTPGRSPHFVSRSELRNTHLHPLGFAGQGRAGLQPRRNSHPFFETLAPEVGGFLNTDAARARHGLPADQPKAKK